MQVLAAATLLAAVGLQAQEFRGSIGGSVSDLSGAMVAGAKVAVVETSTNARYDSKTDNAGHYNVPFLLPGVYDLTVKMDGFKEAIQKAIHLGAGETPTIDIKLQVGDAAVSVEVTDAAPLLNSENASIGQAITSKEVEDLPTNGGSPMTLLTFAMGITPMSQPAQVLPFASGGAASWSISGSANQTNELLVDGVPNATWDGRQAYSPPQDAVSEVRVKAFDSDASYGHTGGGTANQVLKSGNNKLQGTASWKNQPNNLVANDFFRNKSALPVQVVHFNQWSTTLGGPVYAPKVFNGKDKLFWFFAYEGIQDSQPATTFFTVPTAAQKTGDFSQLLTVKTPTILYNPYSATLTGTTINRTAYPGNKIPASQISPVAAKYLGFFPDPNVTNISRDDGYNNFGSGAAAKDGYTNELGRLDYNINQRNRTYFNVRHTEYYQTKNNYFQNIATGSNLSRSNWGGTLDHVFTVNSTNVVDVRANFTRMFEDHSSPSRGIDPTAYGFPSYLGANSQYAQLPTMAFATNSNLTTVGFGSNANLLPSQSLQVFGTWIAIRGAHNLKIGGDLRQYRLNYRAIGNSAGNFSFSANSWVRQSSTASSTVAMGQDFAEFLLGLPTSGSYDINASAMYYEYYGAMFVHDDWRIRRNLTVNLGLRYDHDFPWREKWGRTVNGFDFSSPSPLAAAAQAAYAKSPSASLDPSQFKVLGGLTFASPSNNAIHQNTSHLLSPRVGLAWTPDRFNNRLAVRTGFALFVQPIAISTLQVSGAYSTNPLSLQQGYSQTTSMTPSNNNFLTPAATLSDPFPGGKFLQPTGSAAGLLSFAGQSVNFMNPEMKSPYSVRWNVSLQYQLSANMVAEIAYIGNHSLHLPVTYTQFNGIPRQFLSTAATRDQALITKLSATVPNPFLGLNTSVGTSTTATVAQILAHYPQFPVGVNAGSSGIVMNDNSVGSSQYNSLSGRMQRRLSKGLSIQGTFMRSKMIDQTTWLNDSDLTPERRISPFFRPWRIATAVTYDLPVGKGKLINISSSWLNTAIGGWEITGTYQYQVGGPLTWLNGSTNNPGDYVYLGGKISSNPRNVDGYAFDVTKFDNTAANAFQYHVRTFSTAFSDIRTDGINEAAASVLKKFNFGERRYLQLRAEAFNVLNHPVFGAANTTANNSAFGTITSQANRPRSMQAVLRLVF